MLWKVGCSGFPVAQKKYLEFFRTVEIQKTFYQPPGEETLFRWRAGTPDDFEYVVKVWQVITHPAKSPTYKKVSFQIPKERQWEYGYFCDSPAVHDAWEKTRNAAKILKSRILLFQTPASFHLNSEHKENLRRFFTLIQRESWKFVWEPRGKFDVEEVRILCDEMRLIPCLDPFAHPILPSEFFYIRLHGREGARYRYTEDDFEHLWSVLPKDKPGYIFFNNMHMFEDAVHFVHFLQSRGMKSE